MTNPALSPSSDPIIDLANAIREQMEQAGETLQVRLGGGIEKLLAAMEIAGYRGLLDAGLDFDCAQTVDGDEVLLVHATRPSEAGEWGLLWRSQWAYAQLLDSQLESMVRTLDAGICRLARASQLSGGAA
jgi:hypothetical protein